MRQYIGCDTHLRYSIFRIVNEDGTMGPAIRVEHGGGELERFLSQLPPGSPVALESTGSYGWLVQAIEEAGLEPHMGHALEVKKRIGGTHKTDSVDAKGLAILALFRKSGFLQRECGTCEEWYAAAWRCDGINPRSNAGSTRY